MYDANLILDIFFRIPILHFWKKETQKGSQTQLEAKKIVEIFRENSVVEMKKEKEKRHNFQLKSKQ